MKLVYEALLKPALRIMVRNSSWGGNLRMLSTKY